MMIDSSRVIDIPISEKRKKTFLSEIKESVKKRSIGREIINTIFLQDNPEYKTENINFDKVGFNILMDRIWFVEMPGDTYYGYQGMGSRLGFSIALTETKGVVDEILNSINNQDNIIKVNKLPDYDIVSKAITKLYGKEYEPTTILTHPISGYYSWSKEIKKAFCDRIKVFPISQVPEGKIIVYDKNRIGELIIKKDITATFSEEFDKRKAVLELKTNFADINAKVNVQANVIVYCRIVDINASILVDYNQRNTPK